VFPTLVGLLQFGSWQAVVTIFAALQVIQFLIGSYLEPRLTGKRLAVSPFMVLAAVFSAPSSGACRAPSSACRC
jgi:AI-2 transport protein TqsA